MIMIRLSFYCLLICLLSACTTSKAAFNTGKAIGYYADEPMQCVPYARQVSGFPIYGDAYTWWFQTPEYKRGQKPKQGSVLVLAKTKKLSRGHVAVVNKIIDPRHITVTHSNWGSNRDTRRIIYKSMIVEDLSPANNWTNLRFWNKEIDAYGLPYKAYGFIYGL